MKKILPYLFIFAIFAGCKKNEKSLPMEKAAIGSFSGTVSPADAVNEITATSADGKHSYLTKADPSTGTFSLSDLQEGDYLIKFSTAEKYEKIANLSARIIGGQHTNLAAVNTKEVVPPTQPASGTESFSGTIAPLGAAPRITLYTVGPIGYVRSYPVSMNPASGQFILGNLSAGDYRLHLEPSSGYNKIDDIYFTIAEGKNTDLGSVTFTVNTDRAVGPPLSCNVNGKSEAWTPTTVYNSSSLTIAYFSASFSPRQTGIVYRPGIMLRNVNAPGTYVCNKSSGNQIQYTAYKAPSGLAFIQSTDDSGSEGTVIITSIDRVNRIIKGTFSAALVAKSGDTGSAKLLTNGVINANY